MAVGPSHTAKSITGETERRPCGSKRGLVEAGLIVEEQVPVGDRSSARVPQRYQLPTPDPRAFFSARTPPAKLPAEMCRPAERSGRDKERAGNAVSSVRR